MPPVKMGSLINRQTLHSAISPCGNYLAQDRADGSNSSKQICKDFCAPGDHSLANLKKLCRYDDGRPRLVCKSHFPDTPAKHLDVFRDTDLAGCEVTSRPTSGGCVMVEDVYKALVDSSRPLRCQQLRLSSPVSVPGWHRTLTNP